MNDTFHWLDVERIAEDLADLHSEVDPLVVTFPELRSMVARLPGFSERPGHPVNEKILEAIQAAWIEEREGLRPGSDEPD